MIIGLMGPKGSGKSTLAQQLIEQRKFVRVSFAEPVKVMLKALLDYQGCRGDLSDRMLYGDLKEIKTGWLVGNTPRAAMQTLGTEWGREFHPELWTEIWESAISLNHGKDIVCDDARFINEAKAIRNHGGIILKIIRPGHGPSPHRSEQEYQSIPAEFVIINDSTPEYMLAQFDELMHQ